MKNWKLESVRGAAAFLVLIGHLVLIRPSLSNHFLMSFFGSWGTESVMIFFILSGSVINISFSKSPTTRVIFFLNRIKRIYPQYLIGVALAISVSYLQIVDYPSAQDFFGNLLFLGTFQNYICPVLEGNPVLWSLTYEMFFYLFFALSIGVYQRKVIFVWFIFSIFSSVLYYFTWQSVLSHLIAMFAFSSIWLIGYFLQSFIVLFQKPNVWVALFFLSMLPGFSRLNITEIYYCVIKYLLFSVAAVPFFLYLLKTNEIETKEKFRIYNNHWFLFAILLCFILIVFQLSDSLFQNKLLYTGFPILVILFKIIASNISIPHAVCYFNIEKIFRKASNWLGKLSFSIYIIHFPILLLLNKYIASTPIFVVVGILVVITISFLLEEYFQRLIYFQKNKN